MWLAQYAAEVAVEFEFPAAQGSEFALFDAIFDGGMPEMD